MLTIIGLFIIAFSQEKVDDDRVKIIRGKALQVGFGILLAILFGLVLISIFNTSFSLNEANDLSLIAIIVLIIYLLLFNIGLYYDSKWIYNNETVVSNIYKNKILFIGYILGLASIIVLLMLI